MKILSLSKQQEQLVSWCNFHWVSFFLKDRRVYPDLANFLLSLVYERKNLVILTNCANLNETQEAAFWSWQHPKFSKNHRLHLQQLIGSIFYHSDNSHKPFRIIWIQALTSDTLGRWTLMIFWFGIHQSFCGPRKLRWIQQYYRFFSHRARSISRKCWHLWLKLRQWKK